MQIGEAIDIATAWARDQVSAFHHLVGIYLAGSANRRPREEEFSPLSDIDVYFVVEDGSLGGLMQRKLLYKRVVIDQSYWPESRYHQAENVLGDFGYVDHLYRSGIVFDPKGFLAALCEAVLHQYRQGKWVARRLSSLHEMAISGQKGLSLNEISRADRIGSFIWMCFGICGMPIAAELLPPTTRKCVAVFRAICEAHQAPNLIGELYRMLGTGSMTKDMIASHIADYETAFDYASRLPPAQGFLDFDVSEVSRPLMVDGVKDLACSKFVGDAGLWLLLGWSITINRITKSGMPEVGNRFQIDYERYLSQIGLASQEGLLEMANEGLQHITACHDFSKSIMMLNPVVERE
jgi:hypothetical protein